MYSLSDEFLDIVLYVVGLGNVAEPPAEGLLVDVEDVRV